MPYQAIEQIKRSYDELSEKNKSMQIQYVENAISHFRNHQPPDIPFEPLSFLIVAQPGDYAQIILNTEGKQVAIPIPPPFNGPAEQQRFTDTLELVLKGCRTAHTRGISQKLLAVHSGLGRYGRNNICYIEGLGSYFNLRAFYTDIECEDNMQPLRFMDECEKCGLCRKNCPTGAIGQNSVIDATKCLSMYNEVQGSIPDWIPQSAHHTMISCLRCQEVCPKNRSLPKKNIHTLELDETETQLLLSSDPKVITPELALKLKQFGLNDNFISIAGRNANLALKNLTTSRYY
jgi:epoxyqueuosine reductase